MAQLIFGQDVPCHRCKGTGKAKHLDGNCGACGGSGIEGRFVPEPRLDLPHPARSGEALRDAGIAAVAAAERPWMEKALAHIEGARLGDVITSEGLTSVVGLPESRNAVGAAFGIASRRGWIRPVGIVQSSRPQRHAGRILQWERVR